MHIKTEQQLPDRWVATTEDYDGPGSPIGWGSSERLAIEALVERIIDDERERPGTGTSRARGLILNILAGHRIDAFPPEKQILEECLSLLQPEHRDEPSDVTAPTSAGATPASDQSPVANTSERKAEHLLSDEGVYAGHDGLRQLAECEAFWEQRPYGTRLYFDPALPGRYLHRSILRAAIAALDKAAAQPRPLSNTSEDWEEKYAALEARCYEGFPSASDGIFDALKEARTQAVEEIIRWLDGKGLASCLLGWAENVPKHSVRWYLEQFEREVLVAGDGKP